MHMRIGVLALQGDFEAHRRAVENAGAEAVEVRRAEELDSIDGLIVPGGESTTMLKLLHAEKLWDKLAAFGRVKPIFGTCAGAIQLEGEPGSGLEGHPVEAVFIRAPVIQSAGPGSKVLLRYQGKPVLVEHGSHMVATFHPELTSDPTIHRKFLEKVRAAA